MCLSRVGSENMGVSMRKVRITIMFLVFIREQMQIVIITINRHR